MLAFSFNVFALFCLSTVVEEEDTMDYQYEEGVIFNLSDDYELAGPCPLSSNHSVELVVGPYIHSIICILGFFGNILVIITYAFYKRSKSMTDVYLLNVAIADLLFVVVLPLIVYNELSSWVMGEVACKLLRGAYSVNLYSGMLLLACISTDRYIAIVQARRSFQLRSLPYSRIICAIVWVFAILLSVPTFYFYHRYLGSKVWILACKSDISSLLLLEAEILLLFIFDILTKGL